MNITIDTKQKTIIINEPVNLIDLLEFLEDINIDDYKIIPNTPPITIYPISYSASSYKMDSNGTYNIDPSVKY